MNGETFTIISTSEQTNLEYVYSVNLGGSLLQQENFGDRRTWNLGSHQGYNGLTETFENGDDSGCTQARRATVFYSFGPSTSILSATEPHECEYHFEVQIEQTHCAEIKQSNSEFEYNLDHYST